MHACLWHFMFQMHMLAFSGMIMNYTAQFHIFYGGF